MKYSYVTDKGIRRQENQDCCYAFEPEPGAVFAIVCDGMGGHGHGEVASSTVARGFYNRLQITPINLINEDYLQL